MASWFAKRHFQLRKLHSLTGIVPVGVFLAVHLVTNASILGGPEVFQARVNSIHALGPLLPFVEVFGILLPIAFHALIGVQIWRTSANNAPAYPYAANVRYHFQRVTGILALAFILYHLWHMHWLGSPFGGARFVAESPHAAVSAGKAIQASLWTAPLYAVGILAACYHFANGIWTFLISWGITVGPNAQRKAGYLCAAVGVGLALAGLASLYTFRTTPPRKLQITEPLLFIEGHADGG
jgi:succinate dehydrogenase / fumarate reductase cytochrome b subunit